MNRGEVKESNPKGINRLSCEFQSFYLGRAHFTSSLPVVTDLLMNETISDLALAKVGPHFYLVALYFALNWIESVGC